jgi:hypothetical protein
VDYPGPFDTVNREYRESPCGAGVRSAFLGDAMPVLDEQIGLLVKQIIIVLRSFPERTATFQEVHQAMAKRLIDLDQPPESVPTIQVICRIATDPTFKQVFECLESGRVRLRKISN